MQNKADSSWIVNGKRYHGRVVSDWVKARGGLKGLTREQFLRKYYDPHAYAFVTKGKRKYLYPLDKKMRKLIEPLSQPYPKADAHWVKIDRDTFKKEKSRSIKFFGLCASGELAAAERVFKLYYANGNFPTKRQRI